MYFVYSILYTLALLLSLPYWLLRMMRDEKYRAGLHERLGSLPERLKLPEDLQRSIWIHAVSVGEVIAVSRLIAALKGEFAEMPVFVSTTTLTGQELARERFGTEHVFYMPLDLPFAVNAFLRALRPAMLVLAETEFWPNVLHLAKANGAQIAVVNGRISDRSLAGYRRSRWLLRRVLANIDLFLAQTEADRERLITIGAPAERVSVAGNLKFDVKAPSESPLSRALRQLLIRDQRTLVFGSTVGGEEALLIPCFKAVLKDFPQALIILAPRHPERFDAVMELLRSSGVSFWRRSTWNLTPLAGGVLLLDTIGELASVYSLGDIAFVGGSLVARGGHNILEPAHFAKPILIGPHYENFREIVRTFLAADAVRVVNANELTEAVLQLLREPHEAVQLGARAWEVVEGGRGSTQRTLQALRELLDSDRAHAANASVPRQ
ncbi:MAG TPA: 3-deoxy-D-manno-octulosonic acid transferase [Terriglobales bacterium]|nr:3-deoxy-D-manno-octulosonic acid transferase [Terriglobales bacterium]